MNGGGNVRDIFVFKRIEKKYRINKAEKDELLKIILPRIVPDAHGKSTVCSLYMDTPDYLLIRNSIDANTYKEKLRLRCYNVPGLDTKVFLEIKKKFKRVVYKRREAMPLSQAYDYIFKGEAPVDSQIMREIDYTMKRYGFPQPSMLVAYEREAYFAPDLSHLRITFDSNIRYRTEDLFLEKGNDGITILPEDEMIMEIKTDSAMPLWLSEALDNCKIYPSSFSKYGTSYKQMIEKKKGEYNNAGNF